MSRRGQKKNSCEISRATLLRCGRDRWLMLCLLIAACLHFSDKISVDFFVTAGPFFWARRRKIFDSKKSQKKKSLISIDSEGFRCFHRAPQLSQSKLYEITALTTTTTSSEIFFSCRCKRRQPCSVPAGRPRRRSDLNPN